jgi:hypothetical protein
MSVPAANPKAKQVTQVTHFSLPAQRITRPWPASASLPETVAKVVMAASCGELFTPAPAHATGNLLVPRPLRGQVAAGDLFHHRLRACMSALFRGRRHPPMYGRRRPAVEGPCCKCFQIASRATIVAAMFREPLAVPLAKAAEISAKCWSEWQDLNLRPPRPERGALPDCATLRLKAALITRVGERPQARDPR